MNENIISLHTSIQRVIFPLDFFIDGQKLKIKKKVILPYTDHLVAKLILLDCHTRIINEKGKGYIKL